MIGTFRLLLAAVVVLSHIIASPTYFSFGVSAVAVFFVMSGYAMTGLISTRFVGDGAASKFYLERIVRIAPQYYFWLLVSMIMSFALGWMPTKTDNFIPYGLFSYLTIVPLGLQGTLYPVNTLLIPQAGSLGVEIICYLGSPWMLRSRLLSLIAAVISIGILFLTNHDLLPQALYTYYSAPGPLVLYIIGSFVYQKEWTLTICLSITTFFVLFSGIWVHYNIEFLVGMALGLPILLVLIRLPSKGWDTALGNASYGCFLGHGCVNWTLMTWYKYIPFYTTLLPFLGVSLGCLAGYVSYHYIERPTLAFRKSLRAQGTSNKSS